MKAGNPIYRKWELPVDSRLPEVQGWMEGLDRLAALLAGG